MTQSLYEEPENIPWMFEYVSTNMCLIYREEKLANERHTPTNLMNWSGQALCEQNNFEIILTKKTVPAKTLLPTQSRLNAAKCLFDQITNKWNSLERVFEHTTLNSVDGPQPILTFAEKYIIDGHHRWSQFMLSNPNALVDIVVVPPKRPSNMITRIQKYFLDFDETLNIFLSVNGLCDVFSVEASAERDAHKDTFKINLEQTKEIIRKNITDFCIKTLHEQKQISNADVNEAVNFYIKNIQYILPLS